MMNNRGYSRNLEESYANFSSPEVDSLPLSDWAGELNIIDHI
jgi:hypothetical protein